MFAEPPRGREWVAWARVAVWSVVIFTAIPLARTIEGFVREHWGQAAFGFAVFGVLAAATAAGARAIASTHGERPQPSALAWLLGVALAFAAYTLALWSNPEEALHFVQYGVLAVLIHRALAHRMRDASIWFAALGVGTLIGQLDELIQWVTPLRYWGLRDIWLNFVAGALVQLALARGVRPLYVRAGFSAAGVRSVCRIWIGVFGVLLLCALNTPTRTGWYAERIPGLGFLARNESVMFEYGHLIVDDEIGRFRSRFHPEELARVDAARAEEAAARVDVFAKDPEGYRDFLDAWTPVNDPFSHELGVHLFRRERYEVLAERNRVDPVEYARLRTVSHRENRIAEKYFPQTYALSSFVLGDEERAQLAADQLEELEYESRVSVDLITRVSETQVLASLLLAIAALVWTQRRFGREPRGAPLRPRVALGTGLAALAVVVLRSAWMSDDALITFRTLEHFANGDGLRFNLVERVQAYTHPLWLFVLAPFYAFTREALYTPILVSTAVTLAAAAWLARGAVTHWVGLAGLACLASSKAFVDYASSGLENPLGYLCVAAFAALLPDALRHPTPRRVRHLALAASALALTRLDYALIAAPAGLAVGLRALRSADRVSLLRAGATGIAPLLLWHVFTLFYYGSPVPNTALAKLGIDIPALRLLAHGAAYYADSLRLDPVTLGLVATGLVAPLVLRQRVGSLLAAGIALYGLYTLRIGGDFMSGRFFAVPFFAALWVLVRLPEARALVGVLGATAVALSLQSDLSPLRAGGDYLNRDESAIERSLGVADERGFYYETRGLLSPRRRADFRPGANCTPGSLAYLLRTPCSDFGMDGFTGCRELMLTDRCALADPLLARSPLVGAEQWRIGHYYRRIPRGYAESLASGENRLAHPAARALYDEIRLVTRGPLFSLERLAAIARLQRSEGLAEE